MVLPMAVSLSSTQQIHPHPAQVREAGRSPPYSLGQGYMRKVGGHREQVENSGGRWEEVRSRVGAERHRWRSRWLLSDVKYSQAG